MPRGVKFESKLITRDAYRATRQVRALGEDLGPLLEAWGGILESSVRARFDSGKGPGGVPWPPSKRVIRRGGKTLVDRGNLERSLRFEVRDGKRLLIGFDGSSESAKNAAAHQFGSHRQTVVVRHTRTITEAFGVPLPEARTVGVRPHGRVTNLPARPMLGIDNNDRRDLTEEAQRYVRKLLG